MRILEIKDCKSCPCSLEKEAYGPTYYNVCTITHEEIIQRDDRHTDYQEFPETCPLKTTEKFLISLMGK